MTYLPRSKRRIIELMIFYNLDSIAMPAEIEELGEGSGLHMGVRKGPGDKHLGFLPEKVGLLPDGCAKLNLAKAESQTKRSSFSTELRSLDVFSP